MVGELQRADGMGDTLDGVRLAVGEVVRGVDAPRITRAWVRGVQDAVQHRVAEVDVARRHVDLRAQHTRAVGELARPHPREQVQALLDGAIAPRAGDARLGERPAVLADLVRGQVVDVRLAGADEVDGPVVELPEVVGGVVEVLAPVEAEPVHIRLDGIDVLLLLLGRVGVIEAQVATTAELLRDAEVQADRLGMADMQVAVGLRWEPRDDRPVTTGRHVIGDDVTDEVTPIHGEWLGGHDAWTPGVLCSMDVRRG